MIELAVDEEAVEDEKYNQSGTPLLKVGFAQCRYIVSHSPLRSAVVRPQTVAAGVMSTRRGSLCDHQGAKGQPPSSRSSFRGGMGKATGGVQRLDLDTGSTSHHILYRG
jgi:hypothetical protein